MTPPDPAHFPVAQILPAKTDTASIVIRPTQESDLPAITAIYAHHVTNGTASFELEAPSLLEMSRRFHDLAAGGFPYLVAHTNDIVFGYAYAASYRSRAAYRDTVENSVYLHPEATGRGIGLVLLQALITACEARGHRQMIAVIGITDSLASLRLHERCGFRRVGVLENVGYKNGEWLDRMLLQRPLGPAHTTPPQGRNA